MILLYKISYFISTWKAGQPFDVLYEEAYKPFAYWKKHSSFCFSYFMYVNF